MNAIEVRGLRKSYQGRAVVDGIDLHVATGEVLALLGPNGAGKTTSVEIMEGLRDRTGGDVTVLGTDPAHAGRAWRARIGIVLQHSEDIVDLTVAEVVEQFARYYPNSREPGEVLELVGLTGKASSKVRTLSGGQRRRVDVALGIVGRPELLFLDEPTTGFDPEARRQFWEVIRKLAAEGTTILLTTHYLDEVEALADRVTVLRDGAVVASGDPVTLGGRVSKQATVSWLGATTRESELTDDPSAFIAALTSRLGGSVPELTVTRPSLEDVYLELIGENA